SCLTVDSQTVRERTRAEGNVARKSTRSEIGQIDRVADKILQSTWIGHRCLCNGIGKSPAVAQISAGIGGCNRHQVRTAYVRAVANSSGNETRLGVNGQTVG